MAKVQIGHWELEEEELDRQHQEAQKRGAEIMHREPQASNVSYDHKSNRLVIELKNGVILMLPCVLLQGLAEATPEDIAQVQLGPRGASLHWGNIGIDFSLAGLIAGLFGTHAWMAEIGRNGGSAKSPAKIAAARSNGKKGGRPRQAAENQQSL